VTVETVHLEDGSDVLFESDLVLGGDDRRRSRQGCVEGETENRDKPESRFHHRIWVGGKARLTELLSFGGEPLSMRFYPIFSSLGLTFDWKLLNDCGKVVRSEHPEFGSDSACSMSLSNSDKHS
jgi:hypothetical protein